MSWHAAYLATGLFTPHAGWYAVGSDDKSFIGPYSQVEHAQAVARAVTHDGDHPILNEPESILQ